MKTVALCGIVLLAAVPSFAQTSSQPGGDQPNKTVTLTGCVTGGAESKPITLTNALIVPATPQPERLDGTAPSPVASVSSTGTEPPDPTLPPPTAAPVPSPPSVTGTSGEKTSPSTAPTGGTSGVVTGTAPAGSSASSVTGYRLSGADMQPWLGRRVQLTGVFVAPAAGSATQPPMREFRVVSVNPATGACPH